MLAPKFMNEIFYGQKNFLKSQENFLSDLNPYMLTPDVWAQWNQRFEKTNNEFPLFKSSVSMGSNSRQATPLGNDKFPLLKSSISMGSKGNDEFPLFKPNLRDSLFWCIYVAINGEAFYQSQLKSGTNMINLMMNEKKTISEHFNKNATLLKNSNHKITLAKINEIKCNLMTKPIMDSVESFIPCSIYYGRPIYVYFEEIQSYLRFNDKNYVSDDDDNNNDKIDENIILLELKDGKFSLEHEVSDFMKKKDAFFHIQHYEKVLSGASNYKTDEMREIYKTVFGENAEMKKPEYYEKVLVKISAVLNKRI
jgi:hypothetical protein